MLLRKRGKEEVKGGLVKGENVRIVVILPAKMQSPREEDFSYGLCKFEGRIWTIRTKKTTQFAGFFQVFFAVTDASLPALLTEQSAFVFWNTVLGVNSRPALPFIAHV